MEHHIEDKYLEKVQAAYFDFFKSPCDFPILVVDLQDKDFVDNSQNYLLLKQLILHAPKEKKVHYYSTDLFATTEYK